LDEQQSQIGPILGRKSKSISSIYARILHQILLEPNVLGSFLNFEMTSMFQSYPADAQSLRPELGQYEPTDVTNLDTRKHEAL
jgi:hypothetical protein